MDDWTPIARGRFTPTEVDGEHCRIRCELSADPPAEWTKLVQSRIPPGASFPTHWSRPSVGNRSLRMYCTQAHLESAVEFVDAVIAQANAEYEKVFLAAQAQAAQAAAAREAQREADRSSVVLRLIDL